MSKLKKAILSWIILPAYLLTNSIPIFAMENPLDNGAEGSVYGVPYRYIDKVWEKAPIQLKNWAEELKTRRGDFRSLPYRVFLYGTPGVGKTTMALGIWKQNPDWLIKLIDAGDLIIRHRGAAAEELRRRFNEINTNRKTIIIIDEAHVLMERYAQESTDTSETTEVLKCFIDRQASNRNIMFILTGNSVSDMKASMKQRLRRGALKIKEPSVQELHEMFHYYAAEESLNHESVSDRDLLDIYAAGDIKVGRDIVSFVTELKDFMVDSGLSRPLSSHELSRDLLLRFTRIFRSTGTDFHIGEERLSDREWEERRDERNREFQRELHNDSKSLNKKLTGLSTVAGLTGVGLHYYLSKQDQSTSQLDSASSPTAQSTSTMPNISNIGSSTANSATMPTIPSPESNSTNVTSPNQDDSSTLKDAAKGLGGVAATGTALAAKIALTAKATTGWLSTVGTWLAPVGETATTLVSSHPYVAGGIAVVAVIGSGVRYMNSNNQNNQNQQQAPADAEPANQENHQHQE